MVAEKKCALCGETKPASDFHRAVREPCGLKSRCKPCISETAKTWKPRDPVKLNASVRRWQANNPEKVREIARANYRRNHTRYRAERAEAYLGSREAILAEQKKRYHADAELRAKIIARSRARYAERPEEMKAYRARYRAENPEAVKAAANNARCARAAAEGRTTRAEWLEITDYFDGFCAYCLGHESRVGRLTKDHMQPITRGGSNWPDNLVPACKSCNSAKNAKTPLEFARQSANRADAALLGEHHGE